MFENHRKSLALNKVSEAKYVYILSGQKLLKNAKNGSFWRFFDKPEACGQTVLPDRSLFIGQKLVENAKIKRFKCDILSNFQTMWRHETHFPTNSMSLTTH